MSRLQKDSTIPSVASTSQEDQESKTLKVTLLSSEWRSSTDGDLSTINRELAIQLAKLPNVDVCVLLPNCSREDRSSAESHNVKLIEADKTPGVEPVLCLSSPPINHTMDCVISHGVHLGQQIPLFKKNPNYSHCKWIQVVHSALEENGMYKNISEGEKMQKTEIQLCKMADQVITIGPKLAEVYKRHLCRAKQEKKVFDLTPGIFSEFLEVEQATEERKTFFILVIGSGDSCEDFNVKGYDTAAKAIAELKDESYKLKFVCAAGGKGDIVVEKLLHHGIKPNQLIVRSFDDNREVLANLFCEVDLAIMPSRTEGFGISALEALSAGLPVLVSGNSGLGEALRKVPLGSQSVVDSEDSKDWAKEIKCVRQKEREVRLSESRLLREEYLKKYSWEEPCKSLVIKMRNLVFGGNEQVIRNLQQWQQNASRYKISSNTDPLSDLEKIASEKGYKISDNQGSGNCMFYALSEQLETVKGVKIHHFELRRSLVQYLRELPKQVDGTDLFHFVDRHTTWGGYLTDMEQDGTWGDHVILWAAANCYQIAIHVISSLPGHSEVIIKPDCPFDQSKHLVLGHVHEVHYVSLQPLQEIRSTIPGRDKTPAPVSTDQPHKQLRKELTNHDYREGQNRHLSTEHNQYQFAGSSSTCYRGIVQQRSHPQGQKRHPSTEHDQKSFAGASSTYYRGLVHQRGHPHDQNRHPSTEHDQYKVAGGSSTCYRGIVQQTSHPQGPSSHGLPAPVAVDYSQGNLGAPLVNLNFEGHKRLPSTEHDQNSFAGASSTYYRGLVHQRGHPHGQNRQLSTGHDQYKVAGGSSTCYTGLVQQRSHPQGSSSYGLPAPVAVDYSQGNLGAPLVHPNFEGQNRNPFNEHDQNSFAAASSTYYRGLVHQRGHPHDQNRHPSTEYDQYKIAESSSTCYRGIVQQRSHPQGSFSYGLPAPVAVDYSQGNLHAPLVNLNFKEQNRHPSTEHDQNSFARASSTYYRGLVHQRGHPHGQNRHPSTEHDQYKVAGGSLTCYRGIVQQRSHPQGSSSYGLPAPVAVDYSQGNLVVPLVNLNFEGHNRNPSTEHDQNSFVGASSTYCRGLVHQRGHPHGQNRKLFTEHDQNSFAGASSTYYRGLIHQRGHPHGSFTFDSPSPVAVDYSQGNLPAAFVNPSYQGSQTLPQSSSGYGLPHLSSVHSQSPPALDIARSEDPIHWGSHTQRNAGYSLNKHGQDHFPGAAPTDGELVSQRSGAQDHELVVLRRLLRAKYNRWSHLKPLFWLNTFKPALDDVYTRLSIVSRRKTDFTLKGNEVDMFNIFKTLDKGEDAMVLVEGSPGIGKTTFCLKISHDWANRTIPKESSFPLFELLLLLKCRDIHGDVLEAIVDQLLPEDMDQNATENLKHYIKDIHNQERVLIILDGLDELPKTAESYVDKLLHRQILPFCYVLATSRQEKGIEVRQNVDFDVLLQIKGFTEADSYDYIRKHFRHLGQDYEPKGERLIKAIQENSYLHELPSNPLNLLLLCVVFEYFEGKLPSCRTDLYQIIVNCLLQRYCAKHNLKVATGAANDSDVVSDKALMRHFEDSFLVLGELAWRCLKEDRFSFREKELVEFESTHESLAARTLGFVFKEASLRKINPQHEYFFFHKTFQEYLAAFYLAQMLLKQMVDFSELNFYEDLVERYRQVFVFMSGILGEEAGLLFEQIGKKLKDEDWDWCECSWKEATFFHECFSESRNYEEVAKALFSFIPFPQTITIDFANDGGKIYCFIILNACKDFSELLLPVHLEIVNVNAIANFILEDDDFLSYCTRLQTLSFSVWVMVEQNITLLCKLLRVVSTAYSFTLETRCSISLDEAVAISDSLAANKSLTSITFKVPCEMLKDYVTILDKRLSADTPLTSVVFKIFGSWTETEAELLRKILLNRSLTSLSLTVVEDMCDSLATSVSEGLVANPSLKSLALIVCGKLSYTGLSLFQEGFLGNKSLESLQLKVFGELPTNWVNICGTLQSTMKSTTSFTVYPNVTGMVGNSQVAFLKENLLASKLNSLTVNIWGELECSGATDLCKLVRASSVSYVNLNLNGRITDNVADCLFGHFDKLNTLSNLSIDIQGEVMGDGKNSLQRLSCNQVYLFALNVHSSNSGNKICRDICLTADDSSSLTPVFTKVKDGCITKLSVNIDNPGSISEDWKCNLFVGLAKNECLTVLNTPETTPSLTDNNYSEIRQWWTHSLGDGLAKNTSLTTLSLTVNSYSEIRGEWASDLGDGLGKNMSLTTLSLTVNNYDIMGDAWTRGLGDGLGKNPSLTTLSLTLNNYGQMIGEWTRGLRDGLGKNTSLTTLSLTVNNDGEMTGELTGGLGDGLGKNLSLTTLSLTVNNYFLMEKAWTLRLGGGLGKNTSLTTLSLTVSDYSGMIGLWAHGLGDGLGKNTSLTTLSLTVNNYSDMGEAWTHGLGDGLGKNTSLTTLSLTVNNYGEMIGEWARGLGDGLGKNTSLTTLSLTVNNYSDMGEAWTHGLGDGLGKNPSLTTLSLTVNNYGEMIGEWARGLGDGLGKNTSLTTLSLTVNNYSKTRGEWTHILADGLTKNTSLATLNLTLNNGNNLYEYWIHGLVDALVTNMSSTVVSLEVNIFGEGNRKCKDIW